MQNGNGYNQKKPEVLGTIDRVYMLDNVKRLWAQTVASQTVAEAARQVAQGFLADYQAYEFEVKQYLGLTPDVQITIDLPTGQVYLRQEEPADMSKFIQLIQPKDAT